MDIERFRTLALQGASLIHERPNEAAGLLLKALELFDADSSSEDTTGDPRWEESLRVRDQVVRYLASIAADSGDHDAAIRYLLRLAETDRAGTESLLEVVRAAAAAGRHGEARRFYRRYVARMEKIPARPAPFPGPGRP